MNYSKETEEVYFSKSISKLHSSRENYSSLDHTSEINIDTTLNTVRGGENKSESSIIKKLRKAINPNSDLPENMNNQY